MTYGCEGLPALCYMYTLLKKHRGHFGIWFAPSHGADDDVAVVQMANAKESS